MLMVIFGAGASYDSAPSCRAPPNANSKGQYWDLRPPLANELFDDRAIFSSAISRYSRIQPIIPHLRHFSSNSSVEQELEKLQTDADEDPVKQKQLAAVRFYLQEVIWKCQRVWNEEVAKDVSNYKTLLEAIRHWRRSQDQSEPTYLVTFNYDKMLEIALRSVDVRINDLSDYIASEYKLIKLHGSVDWVHPVADKITWTDMVSEVIEMAANLKISLEYEKVDLDLSSGEINKKKAFFPALAVPVQNKQRYECPVEHVNLLRDCLSNIRKLLVVGWSATEQNFLQLLSEKLSGNPQVKVVSSGIDSAKRVIQNLENAGVKGNLVPSESGFSDFVSQHFADEFLKK